MSRPIPSSYHGQFVHLTLRARGPGELVRDEEDWLAFSAMARRMLFWCGGAVHGCRCEGGEIHLAVTVGQASVGCMVRHLSGAYSRHLGRRYGATGGIFRRYTANRVDADLHLDDLVIWLHRHCDRPASSSVVWTADEAYLKPHSSDWITTDAVLEAMGGASGLTYRRLTSQALPSDVIAILSRNAALKPSGSGAFTIGNGRPAEAVARLVANHLQNSYGELCSRSRKRALSRAKVITAVLCARRGVPAAEIARLFRRSRSTLVEQVEHYRRAQPHIFDDAEHLLDESLAESSRDSVPLAARKRFAEASWPGARCNPP